MPMCINCGSDKVERQGDAFTCHKCQFQWDVAFEQANKVYLRAQGRQPAASILETVTVGSVVTVTSSQADAAALPTATTVATADQSAESGVLTATLSQTEVAAATGTAVPSLVATPAHPQSESVGGDAGPAGAPEPPSADPVSKAAATPAPDVQPPSTPKGKKG